MAKEYFVKEGDVDVLKNDVNKKISSPNTAKVGQILSVKAVDNSGKPTEWEVIDKPGSGPGESSPYTYITVEEYASLTTIDPDKFYWVLNSEGKHVVYKSNNFVEGLEPIKWEIIQLLVRNGIIQNYYSVGDQLPVNYNGSTVMFDIVAFDVATPADSNYTHSMTLMPHDCLDVLMFDNKEPKSTNSFIKDNGNNRYSYSNIRKWLNSSGEAGNWWTAQHSADAAPDYATTKSGFMSYFDSYFLSAIGKTKIRTAKNTITDGGGYEDLSDEYFYLPSKTEVGLGNENSIAEGVMFPYFDSNAKRIKYYNGSTEYWWLRTPRYNYAYDGRAVSVSGGLYTPGADYENIARTNRGVAPACNII